MNAARDLAATQAIEDVLAERQRQIRKGYTPEHDDEHAPAKILRYCGPFDWSYVTRRQLVRIAACAIAAIERYDRAGVDR